METPDVSGHLLLLARTVALDMMLRAIVAQWAQLSPDPEAFVRNMIESIIGSMDEVRTRPAANSPERQVWDLAETELRAFMENVCLRLSVSREPPPT